MSRAGRWRVSLGLVCVLVGASASAQAPGPDPRQELAEARAEERSVLDELDAIDRELVGIDQERLGLEDKAQEVERRRAGHEAEVAAADLELDARRGDVAARVGALHRLHRRGLARIVFGAEDPVDLRRRAKYLEAIIAWDMARLEAFSGIASKRRQALRALDSDVQSIAAIRAELESKEEALRAQRGSRAELLEDIRTRRVLALRALSEFSASGRSLGQRLSMTGSAWDGGGESAATKAGFNPARFREQYGRLPWPASGNLVRRFGTYTDPLTGESNNSRGVVLSASSGTPIRAIYDGYVAAAEFIPGYGQTVVLEHGSYATVYAHANGIVVRKGQQVRTGEVIGYVGNTGLTDGGAPQLGFEVLYNGTPQDPLPWLQGR